MVKQNNIKMGVKEGSEPDRNSSQNIGVCGCGRCGNKRLRVLLLMVIVLGLLAFYHQSTISPTVNFGPSSCARVGAEVLEWHYRLRLAKTLDALHTDVNHQLRGERLVDGEWAVRLEALVAELAPHMARNATSDWDYSARLLAMGPAPLVPGITRHVCPEVYMGRTYDSKFHQHGMETEKCNYVPPFNSVLTAVLPAFSWPPETINFVLAQIRTFYDIPIIIIVHKILTLNTKLANVIVLPYDNNTTGEADVLNKAIQQVMTPYVLVGLSLAHFSNQSSLERLVRVLDELDHVKVAGGAARDLKGHWIHGCLQQRMADYQATYTMGYYYSKYECMYCDDVLTPFVTSSNLLRKVTFSAGLKGPAVYRDWFAQVRRLGHLTMLCPDVMFFLTNHTTMTSNDWLTVARRWALQKVYTFTGEVHEFSCDSVKISCKNPLKIINSFLLPPCCRAIMETELGNLIDFAETNNLEYELHAGSALGAVKMGGYLPWDFDMDIGFETNDYKKWLTMRVKHLKKYKCNLKVNIKNIYFVVNCPYFFLEFYSVGKINSRQFLPIEYRNISTTILYGGRWIKVSSNPGLHARNGMGFDMLKHASHWRTAKISQLGKDKGGYDNPGVWQKCEKPEHHSCYDHYPADGNLPFLQPFLNV
nr:uncharacterized protein LOC123761593 isoform X1 [Procambarus clarkii]